MPSAPTSSFIYRLLLAGVAIEKNASLTTNSISIAGYEGYFSVYFQVSGTGTASLVYELSHDAANWSQVTVLSTLITGHTASTGPTSNGITYLYFNPPIAAYMRFKITEANVNPIVVTLSVGGI